MSVLDGLVVMTFTQLVRDQGSIPSYGTQFFQIAKCHRFNPPLPDIRKSSFYISLNSPGVPVRPIKYMLHS